MTTEKKTQKKRKKTVWLLTAVHLLCAVVYRLFFHTYSDAYGTEFPYVGAAYPSMLSDGQERIISIFLSFVMGVLLIYAIWYILCRAWREKRRGVFIIIAISLILALIIYPFNFSSYETDNILVYYMAVRDIMDYWQNCYMTCIYNACLIVFPQPFMISAIQCAALLGTIYYCCIRLGRRYSKKVSYLPWAILLFPEMQPVALNPYRNCINTIMCLAFFCVLFLDALEGRKRTKKELALLGLAAGFLTVFRSEQILILCIFLLAVYFLYGKSLRQTLCYAAFGLAFCAALSVPQKLGEQKYYGKDYAMVNNMETLFMILSKENVNLSYDGAKEDLEAIEKICPVYKIKIFGLAGYRGHIYHKYKSMNQSFAAATDQKAFIHASGRLLFHNPALYVKARMRLFLSACSKESAVDNEFVEPPQEMQELALQSAAEILEAMEAYNQSVAEAGQELEDGTVQSGLLFGEGKMNLIQKWLFAYADINEWLGEAGVIFAVRLIGFLLFPLIVFYTCKEKLFGTDRLFWIGVVVLLYGQLAAIFLLSPEGREAYYYPVFFVMVLGSFLLLLNYKTKKASIT